MTLPTQPPHAHRRKDEEMASNVRFQFDPRNLPDNLKSDDQKAAFLDAVFAKMQASAAGVDKNDAVFAAVVGMLVLDGNTDPSAASFDDAFWSARGESAKTSTTTTDKTTLQVLNKHVYEEVAGKIKEFPGHKGAVYYQELASVARKLLDNADAVPIDSPGFISQIRVFDDDYVTNGPSDADSFDLPDLTGDGAASPDDIRPDNIRAVAVIFAAYQLEQLRLFEVVDRITETWWNGQLPVGTDKGSQALDKYYWSSEFRLSDSARHMQYGRVLGAAGGEVSTEVQPNSQFSDLWMRLIASLAEYDRQQRIGDVVGGQRKNSLTLTGESVRAAARNLAANASLYGWGGTQFAARRLAKQVSTSFDILNSKEIQAAYGVDGPYKVIERVATEQWGAAPNIVKYRALAEAGRNMLNTIAKYSRVWSGSGNPLFNDPASSTQSLADSVFALAKIVADREAASHAHVAATGSNAGDGSAATPPVDPTTAGQTADIQDGDRDTMLREAGNVIAVQGIKDDVVAQLSQPSEAQYAPSIPTLGGGGGSNGAGGGGQGIDQLRQMVSQGQVPDMNTLKNLVMGSH